MSGQVRFQKYPRIVISLAVFAIVAILMVACGGNSAAPSAVEPTTASGASAFYLNPYKDECLAAGELKLCYVARATTGEEFTTYAGEVENFDYEWGYGYALTGRGDGSVFTVEEVTNKTAEPGGTQFDMTITGGGNHIVLKGDGVYELYGEKTFTCDPTASCETLDRVINREQPITFKFKTPVDPADPLILLSWDSVAVPAQVGEEPGLMFHEWDLQSVTVSKDQQQLTLAGTAVTANFALNDSFSAGTVTGNAGCNDYSADVTLDGNAIKFTNIVRGDVQCSNPPGIMEQEQLYLGALPVVQDFLVDGDRLELNYNSGDSVLNMVATP